MRVIESPTPRWTAYDTQRFGIQMRNNFPMVHQERAYTSPIWYTPQGVLAHAGEVVSPAGLEPAASGLGKRWSKSPQSPEFWALSGSRNRPGTDLGTERMLVGACSRVLDRGSRVVDERDAANESWALLASVGPGSASLTSGFLKPPVAREVVTQSAWEPGRCAGSSWSRRGCQRR